MEDKYDLVVIGAGPAGEVAAELAASFGRRVLVVERSKPGGVVTTTGGAPTKALREAAVYLTGFRQEEVYGVRAAVPLEEVVPILRARVERVRDVLQDAVAQRLAARGIAYLRGNARLGADRTVRVTSPGGEEEHRLEARAILLATGSRPTHPVGVPFDDPDVYDSNPFCKSSQMASNPALCPPDTTSLGKSAAASSASGSSVCQAGRPRRTTGVRGTRAAATSGGSAAASVPTACKKRSDPLLVRHLLVPNPADLVHQCLPGWMSLPQGERAWFEERERERLLRPTRGRVQCPETTIGMADQMRTVLHQLGDVVGIT